MFHLFAILAQEGAKPEGGGGGGFGSSIFYLLPIILMLYLLIVVLPGRRRQEKERQELLNKMTKGDKVLTIAGIYGEVISVSPDKDEVVVKVDDGTRLRMTKGSIARNMTAEENLKKAKEAPAQASTQIQAQQPSK